MFNEIPIMCRNCNAIAMVDFSHMEKRPFSAVIIALGFWCENCGGWETVSIETAALLDLYKKIGKARPGSNRHAILMVKAIEKIQAIIKKVRTAWQEQAR